MTSPCRSSPQLLGCQRFASSLELALEAIDELAGSHRRAASTCCSGAATVFAATEGINGLLYISSARGRFFRPLDGLDPVDGSGDFQVPPWLGDGDNDTPDIASIAGTPTHDPDGNASSKPASESR